jgi:hypothetical protein
MESSCFVSFRDCPVAVVVQSNFCRPLLLCHCVSIATKSVVVVIVGELEFEGGMQRSILSE